MENLKEEIYYLYITQNIRQNKIAQQLNLKKKQVEYWIKKWGFIRNPLMRIPIEKISLNDPQFCYFLGLWIADGYINKKQNVIELSLKTDKYLLENIAKYLNPLIQVKTYTYKTNKHNDPIYRINLCKDDNLLQFLKLHGLNKSDKSFTARLPLPENYMCAKMLLRGYIDGDGNIRNGFRAFTASEQLKDDLVFLVKKYFNYDLTVSPTKTKQTKGFTISSRMSFLPHIIDIYQDFEDLRIKRKVETIKEKVYDIVHSHKIINYGSWGLTP
jgi:intein/homing endonuclease